jgi:hypothetical protein
MGDVKDGMTDVVIIICAGAGVIMAIAAFGRFYGLW